MPSRGLGPTSAHPVPQAYSAALPVHTPAVLADVTESRQGKVLQGEHRRRDCAAWDVAQMAGGCVLRTGLRIGRRTGRPAGRGQRPREGAADYSWAGYPPKDSTPQILKWRSFKLRCRRFAAKLGCSPAPGDIKSHRHKT